MIVITTPAGNIGSKLVRLLLENGQKLRLIARHPHQIPEAFRNNCEMIEGSHGDLEVIDKALDGANSLFWLRPPNPKTDSVEADYLDFTRPACEAMKKHGVQHVVGVSALGRNSPLSQNAGLVTAALAMDDLIASTGIPYRALTMPSFMDNLLRQVEMIRHQNKIVGTLDPDRKLPACATADIALVASRLLVNPTWTGRDEVPVLGPEDLSFNEIAAIASEVLGKKIIYQQISLDDHQAQLLKHGMSEPLAKAYIAMLAAKNKGLDNAEVRTPDKTTPTSFRQWCETVLKPAVLSP